MIKLLTISKIVMAAILITFASYLLDLLFGDFHNFNVYSWGLLANILVVVLLYIVTIYN